MTFVLVWKNYKLKNTVLVPLVGNNAPFVSVVDSSPVETITDDVASEIDNTSSDFLSSMFSNSGDPGGYNYGVDNTYFNSPPPPTPTGPKYILSDQKKFTKDISTFTKYVPNTSKSNMSSNAPVVTLPPTLHILAGR